MSDRRYDLVIYHDDCPDGWCSAWVAMRSGECEGAKLFAAQHGQPAPRIPMDASVLMVDFSYPKETMIEMATAAAHLTVLDHHKSAEQPLADFTVEADRDYDRSVTVVFDQSKCGARLCWEHFHPDKTYAPALVCYVEDRDLWKWAIPRSREVNAAISSYPHTLEMWDEIAQWCSTRLGTLTSQGEAILRYQQRVVDGHVAKAVEGRVAGHDGILVCNATTCRSEIAGALAKGRPFGATYRMTPDGKTIFDLRSDEDGLDVSEVARKMGGGGHKRAAGFTL